MTAKNDAQGAESTATTQAGLSASAATTAQSARDETITQGGNNDFTAGPAGWGIQINGAGAIEPYWHDSYGGRAGVVLSPAGVRRDIGHKRTYPIDPLRSYRIRAIVRAYGGTTQNLIGCRSLDANGNAIGINSGLTYAHTGSSAPAEGWVLVERIFSGESSGPDVVEAGKFRLGTRQINLIGILNYGNVAGAESALDGIWIDDVTESVRSAGFANASADSASTASAEASVAAQSAQAADTARLAAETARGQALTYRNEAVSARDDAAGSAISASASEAIVAETRKRASATLADTFPKVLDPALLNATIVTSGSPYDLASLDETSPNWIDAGRKSVTPPPGEYQIGLSGLLRFEQGRTYRLYADVEIIADGGAAIVRTGFYGRSLDADYGATGNIALQNVAYVDLAQGQRGIIDYTYTRGTAVDPGTVWWRPGMLINRLTTASGIPGARSTIHALWAKDITDTVDSAESASAAATSAATAATKASEAEGYAGTATTQAGISVQAKNDAQTAASASQASAANANADAASAALAAQLSAEHEETARLSNAATFPTVLDPNLISKSNYTGPTSSIGAIADTDPAWIVDNGAAILPPAGHAQLAHIGLIPLIDGEIHEAVIEFEGVQSTPYCAVYLGLLGADLNFVANTWAGIASWGAGASVGENKVARGRFGKNIDIAANPGVLNITDANAKFARVRALWNRNSAAGGDAARQAKLLGYYARNVTSEQGSAAQAMISQQQAVAASGSASSALADRQLTAQYRQDALNASATASTQASISEDEAAVATAQAAAAQRSAELSASIGGGFENKDPGFDMWPSGQSVPSLWSAAGSGALSRVDDGRGGYAPRVNVGAADGYFFSQTYNPFTALKTGVWVVLEAEVTLHSGSLSGSGLMIRNYSAAGSSLDDLKLRFATDPDVSGAVPAGPGTYVFRKLVQVTTPTAIVRNIFYAMVNNTNHGALAAKDITISRAGWRFASDAEIAAQTALPALEASVSSQEQALQDLDTSFASLEDTVQAQGVTVTQHTTAISEVEGDVANMAGQWGVAVDVNGRIVGRVRLDGTSQQSSFVVTTNVFKVENPSGGAGMTWTTDANGRPTLNVDDGAGSTVEIGWCP